LFTVHASLAEFELAFKAYDSYVEIVTRGKDRAEKTGEDEGGLDSDTMILRTSAEAIRLLCRFGSRKEAEKALQIGENIERWVEQTQHIKSTSSEAGSIHSIETAIHPRALAVTYSALGISQAHWARYTYEADARTSIQSKAVQYLQKSLEPRFEDPNNVETLYALALVLAEMREVPRAIKVAKRALSPATQSKNALSADGVISGGLSTEYGRERKLIAVWHLLALLLTTRSEYTAAEKSCENAFAQFGTDPTILFGKEDDDAYRSEHLNQANGNTSKSLGIVDQMETFEKSGILQVKMTQLALVETVEGATAAVDGCDELLALYARLFGDPAAEAAKLQPPPTATAAPLPKSAVGTIRGSIFRGKGSVKGTNKDTTARNSSIASSRPSTVATANPTIQVTDENGSSNSKQQHHSHLFHHKNDEGERPGVQRSPSNKLQKRSANSLRRRSEMQAKEAPEVPDLPGVTVNGTQIRNSTVPSHTKSASLSSSLRKSIEGGRPLGPIAHNLPHSKEPPPAGHPHQPPKQDARLPAPLPGESYIPPDPRFSLIQTRRQKVSLLVDIWIFISGLYVRAAMFEDAKGAVSEALKLAQTFEGEVAQESSSSKAFADRGWGGGRSVEQLWADAFAAVSRASDHILAVHANLIQKGELMLAQSLKHEARVDFERAMLHYPDHPEAIVGLSNILLDIYCKIISLEPNPGSDIHTPSSPPSVPSVHESDNIKKQHLASHTPSAENQISAPELNRLAARDRAFGLLSTLTKLGAGWDYSEAWYALARAYEESGQLQKTKEVLWWCVELEDTHPIRSWKNVGLGGFVL
jgi:tetratricopeptide (TPR) repeat protein